MHTIFQIYYLYKISEKVVYAIFLKLLFKCIPLYAIYIVWL
jgi:hypothetical protein